jgi:dinuclear metal center YbgI/SA1388 family protein
MKIKEIVSALDDFAPLQYQEEYDNSGLLIGDPETETNAILCSLDINENVIDEAIEKGTNLIIAHHPLIFGGVRQITGKTSVEKVIIRAIKEDIAIVAAHTNMDNIYNGVNKKICDKINLKNCKILDAKKNLLYKLVTFVPEKQAGKVRDAIFTAGAGFIGDYDCCSFNIKGEGSFRGLEGTNPYVGKKGEIHFENEIRIETILPKNILNSVLSAMIKAHPYEEVAYDIYPLANVNHKIGAGMIGNLENPVSATEFLERLKKVFQTQIIRHSNSSKNKISKVAVCGGSGSFLIETAIRKGADAFVTGDIKYHQFFDYSGQMMIADIGHYESEQFTKEIFYDLLTEKFPKFAVHLSKINTNPINYFY